jgi:hypothetical protein
MSTAPAATAYAPQRLGAGRTHVLDARDRYPLEAQRGRQRNRGVAHRTFHRRSVPGGADLFALDPRIRQRLGERLGQQLFGTRVPAFAEARAAHADDRDLVFDSAGHAVKLSKKNQAGTAFQK